MGILYRKHVYVSPQFFPTRLARFSALWIDEGMNLSSSHSSSSLTLQSTGASSSHLFTHPPNQTLFCSLSPDQTHRHTHIPFGMQYPALDLYTQVVSIVPT